MIVIIESPYAGNVALSAIDEWGLHFRGIAFNWVKTTQAGKVIGGQGVRSSLVKPTTEYVIWAARKPKGRPLPLKDESVWQNYLGPRPQGVHSRKPEEIQDRIERLVDGPYLELFSRRQRPGWTCRGKESGDAD